jgi:hypothetical protein
LNLKRRKLGILVTLFLIGVERCFLGKVMLSSMYSVYSKVFLLEGRKHRQKHRLLEPSGSKFIRLFWGGLAGTRPVVRSVIVSVKSFGFVSFGSYSRVFEQSPSNTPGF